MIQPNASHTGEIVAIADLPLGAHFRYVNQEPNRPNYILLERHGYGLCCTDESERKWVAGQFIGSIVNTEKELSKLRVIHVPQPAAVRELVEAARERDAFKQTIDRVIEASGWTGEQPLHEFIGALRAGLRKYGRHSLRCMLIAKMPNNDHCTCGFAALAALPEGEK